MPGAGARALRAAAPTQYEERAGPKSGALDSRLLLGQPEAQAAGAFFLLNARRTRDA